MALMKWEPGEGLATLRREIDRLFDGSSAWKRDNSLILKGNIERLVATWTLPLFS